MHPDAASDLLALHDALATIRQQLRDADRIAARLVGWSEVGTLPDRVRGLLVISDRGAEDALLLLAPHVGRTVL